MRILFLSQHYVPEPCDSRTSQLAEAMAARGHRCTALTSFPNYPFGKVYEGYRQTPLAVEHRNGVRVLRVPMIPDHSRSKKKRALSYLSFGVSATLGGLFATGRPDLLWIHHPPLTTAIAGALVARLKRVPFVLEIHDLWPETLTSSGMISEGRVTQAIERVCGWLYRQASSIVVTSEGMAQNLAGKGVPRSKVEVMYQWANEAIYRPTPRDGEFGRQHGFGDGFHIAFAGNLGAAQGLPTILEAAETLRGELVTFHLIGDGLDRSDLEAQVARDGLTNVRFHGHHPAEAMPRFFACADALLIHLRHAPLFEIMLPSKTQAYLASGRPILCGVGGEANDLIERVGAGRSFASGDAAGLVRQTRAMMATSEVERHVMGHRARQTYEQHFAKESLVLRYEALFRRLAGVRETAVVEVASERVAEAA